MALLLVPLVLRVWELHGPDSGGSDVRPCDTGRHGGSNGINFLVMRFTAEDGRSLQAKVGPFRSPPALVGGVIDVVHDPKDLSNVGTPGQMTSGRVALPTAIASGLMLALSVLFLFFGA